MNEERYLQEKSSCYVIRSTRGVELSLKNRNPPVVFSACGGLGMFSPFRNIIRMQGNIASLDWIWQFYYIVIISLVWEEMQWRMGTCCRLGIRNVLCGNFLPFLIHLFPWGNGSVVTEEINWIIWSGTSFKINQRLVYRTNFQTQR